MTSQQLLRLLSDLAMNNAFIIRALFTIINTNMKQDMKVALYHKMLEPSLLSIIVSIALASTNLIYVSLFINMELDYSINSLLSIKANKTSTRSTYRQHGDYFAAEHIVPRWIHDSASS